METATKPRKLEFDDFDEVAREAERLLKQPYQKLGNWELSQVCNHLADVLTRSITTGVRPMVPFFVQWYVKWRYLNRVLERKRLPSGVKAPDDLGSPPSADAAAAVQRLRQALTQFKSHPGDYKPHPYFGRLTPDQARQFHLIHCAHHFRLLVPAE
jgi:hypothetical protein